MRKEGKIALGIFAFHLIFGLQSLDGPNGRFISPHLLDDIILLVLGVYFLVISRHSVKYVLIGSIILNSIAGFIAAPHFLALFENLFDLQRFVNFIKNNESEISTAQIIVLSGFFLISTIWSVLKLKTAAKRLKTFLWIRITLFSAGYLACLVFKINLIVLLSAIFIVDGLMIANVEIEEPQKDENLKVVEMSHTDIQKHVDLNETEYRYVLLIFLSMLLIILEYISTSGLISV